MPLASAGPHIFRRLRHLQVPNRRRYRRVADALRVVMDEEAHGEAIAAPPSCFGQRCALTSDLTCQACPVQMLCLHRMAHVRLPRLSEQIGHTSSFAAAEQIGIEPKDVMLAQDVARMAGSLARRDVNAEPTPVRAYTPQRNWAARYLAERQRHPLMRRLRPGHCLIREFDGERYVVTVQDGHYEMSGVRYPTLFAVGQAITGIHLSFRARNGTRRPRALCSWSTLKLFGKSIEAALQNDLAPGGP